ncbi:hypothetical protein YC2023_055630 [Brassica napus]
MDAQLSVQYLINEVGFSLYNRQLPRHCDGMITTVKSYSSFGCITENIIYTPNLSDRNLPTHKHAMFYVALAQMNLGFLIEIPRFLYHKKRNQMSDYISHRVTKLIVDKVLHQQEVDVCWAIALTRQLQALLRLHGVIAADAELSIQYLINEEGGIQDFETVRRLFTEGGPVLKHDCPLTYDLHATNPCFDGKRRYSEVEIKTIYVPTLREMISERRENLEHLILLCGSNTDENEIPYLRIPRLI